MFRRLLPNILTILRILLSAALPFISDTLLLPIYFLTGITDMLDGALARKWSVDSLFGARLDSLADLLFVVAAFIRGYETLLHEPWIIFGIAAVLLIRLIGWIRCRHFLLRHSTLNRLTGLIIFLLYPFYLLTGRAALAFVMICSALAAAVCEVLVTSR